MALPPLALDSTLGEPITFPATYVVKKLSCLPMLVGVNESQKHTAVQKKQVVYKCLQCDTIYIQFIKHRLLDTHVGKV